MPQELQVLRCYSCEAFQVHIVKKSPKWECKICGEKQSIKKVYARGSGKDCRLHVQELNQKRLESNDEQADEVKTEYSDPEENVSTNVAFNNIKPNRWAEFTSPTVSPEVVVENNEISNYTFEQPIKKCKRTQLHQKYPKVTGGSLINETNDGASSHAAAINEKRSNCTADTEERGIFNHIPPKPKRHKRSASNQILQEADQKSHIKKKGGKDPFSCGAATNETSVSVKSSKWAEFISTTNASSDGEIENYDWLSNAVKKPSETHARFEDLNTNKINGKMHQILDNSANASVYTQECKPDVSHFQSSSSKWNELKKDAQFDPDKMLTNSSSDYDQPSLRNRLMLEKASDLFNDGENNLDSIFTF